MSKARTLTAILCASLCMSACGGPEAPPQARLPAEAAEDVEAAGRAEMARCEEALLRVGQSLQEAVSTVKAAMSCTEDSDCILADVSVSCFGECPVAIPSGQEAALRERVMQIGAQWCTPDLRCASSPVCLPSAPGCSEGRCVNVQGNAFATPREPQRSPLRAPVSRRPLLRSEG